MATQQLDLSQISPNYVLTVDLDTPSQTFTFTFRYIQRSDSWLLDIDDAAGNAVLHGIKLVADMLPLARVVALNRPPGHLYVFDTTLANIDPGFSDLGGDNPRVIILYTDAADVAGAQAGGVLP